MSIKIFLSIFFACNLGAYAGPQMTDFLVCEGDTLAIYSDPLEAYFQENDINPSASFPALANCWSTACWRGYVAFWELRNDSIFLKKIRCCNEWNSNSSEDIDVSKLFGDKWKNNEVFADWISRELIHAHGERMMNLPAMEYILHEFETGFDFKNGLLVQINEYDNRKTKQSAFKKDSLITFLIKTIDWDLIERLELGDKNRVIASFKTDDNGLPVDVKIVRGLGNEADEVALRVIKLIPEWDVYFRKGKAIETNWSLPIFFDKKDYEEKQ